MVTLKQHEEKMSKQVLRDIFGNLIVPDYRPLCRTPKS